MKAERQRPFCGLHPSLRQAPLFRRKALGDLFSGSYA